MRNSDFYLNLHTSQCKVYTLQKSDAVQNSAPNNDIMMTEKRDKFSKIFWIFELDIFWINFHSIATLSPSLAQEE